MNRQMDTYATISISHEGLTAYGSKSFTHQAHCMGRTCRLQTIHCAGGANVEARPQKL